MSLPTKKGVEPKKEGSRHSWFVELDKPALRPLPRTPYRYGEWTGKRKVQCNYHVSINQCYYSVPFKFAEEVIPMAKYTAKKEMNSLTSPQLKWPTWVRFGGPHHRNME